MAPPSFDIVLVLNYFRSAGAYLAVIKHLAPTHSIGLLVTPLSEDLMRKNREAHEHFIALCEQVGATVLGEEPVRCDLMVVQQRVYEQGTPERVRAQVEARRTVGLLNLTMMGIALHDRFLGEFGVEKVYVPCRRLFDFMLAERDAAATYASLEVAQVGLPFGDYPVFEEFEADWLIASPTTFSFSSERGKHQYLEDVLELLAAIGPEDRVVYKPHNSEHGDYLDRRGYGPLGRFLARIPGARRMISRARRLGKPAGRFVEKVYTGILYADMKRRVEPIDGVTPHHQMSLEAFLPHVRKGVIGGLSNTIWGTLYFGLTYYNCVDSAIRQADHRSAGLLDLNLRFFFVPYCEGDIDKGSRGEGVVTPEDRHGDLLAEILADLKR